MGLRLGFFQAIVDNDTGEGVTSVQLAAATQKSERWLREWLASQAGAGILEWNESQDGTMRYSVAPETRELLLDASSKNYSKSALHWHECDYDLVRGCSWRSS